MFIEGSNRICSQELLAKIADVIDTPILITRHGHSGQYDHKIIYINPAFTRLTGYTAHELIGRSPDILCDPRTSGNAMLEFYSKCRQGQNFAVNLDSFKKQGAELKLNIDVRPIHDDFQGSNFFVLTCKTAVAEAATQPAQSLSENTGLMPETNELRVNFQNFEPVNFTDSFTAKTSKDPIFTQSNSLTEEQQKNELHKIPASKSKAEIANDEAIAEYCKTQFLANMSHDLRTPLNAIIGFSEVIKDQLFGPIENPRYVSYARDIFKSGQELLGTISEIMELAEVSPDTNELTEERIDLNELVEAVIDIAAPKAFEGDVRIIRALDVKDLFFRGDKIKLKQALAGVLGNVVRNSARGSKVEISTNINERGDFRLVIYAKTAQIGVSKSNNPLHGTITKKVEAEFPEIAMAHKFVEAHEGKFNIFNSAASGTEITVTLPFSRLSIESDGKRLFKVIS